MTSKLSQLRRSFGTIYQRHILEDNLTIGNLYYRLRKQFVDESGNWSDYLVGAIALEECPTTGRVHVQFYLEHKRKRFSSLSSDLGVMATCFDVVRDAQGSWDYCSGSGAHRDKPALERFQFGTPKLHGDTQRADLKLLVGLIMDNIPTEDIIKAYPYAWCVHRARLLPFIQDWKQVTS